MVRHTSIPLATAVLGLFAAPLLPAQQQLPAQQPTGLTAPHPQAHHSAVSFHDGLLTVEASNASLNGILREIAHSTGMKITGSAPEDRVFGTYGPADPQRVMSTLLDGTGINILIVSNTADKPLELLLTPRLGSPTPPNPNAEEQQQAEDSDEPNPAPQRQLPVQSSNLPMRPIRPGGQRNASPDPAAATAPSEVSQPVVFPPISPTTAPATATTTPPDPDNDGDTGTETVKTPQQIFDELQHLQQNGNGSGNGTQQTPPDSNQP